MFFARAFECRFSGRVGDFAVLAFPDFEFWFLAWFALVPLFFASSAKKNRRQIIVRRLDFRNCVFFRLVLVAHFRADHLRRISVSSSLFSAFSRLSRIVGFFSAIFAAVFSILKRFGVYGIFAAPFLWTATEFLRFWTTGNNWNAIGYSQAFHPFVSKAFASIGGIYLVSFLLFFLTLRFCISINIRNKFAKKKVCSFFISLFGNFVFAFVIANFTKRLNQQSNYSSGQANVVAVQPNVPMSGLNYEKYQQLETQHVELAENALQKFGKNNQQRTTDNRYFPRIADEFYVFGRHGISGSLSKISRRKITSPFCSTPPSRTREQIYFNSAVMIDPRARKSRSMIKFISFRSAKAPVPAPLKNIVPTLVGSFSYGENTIYCRSAKRKAA
jgi:apolipoprotein N-acyltransferase